MRNAAMSPIDFPRANLIASRRAGGAVTPLPIAVKGGHLTTAWRPTREEVEILRKGGVVMLTIASEEHPPVSVAVAPERDLELVSAAAG